MIETVKNFLNKYDIKDTSVLIGFSGGADSCCLALILSELREEFNLKLNLLYFNHGWREEAKKEEDFAREFGDRLKAVVFIGHAPKNLPKTEECARDLRYEFFEKSAKKLGSNIVFLAHNKNDNVETIVYRIIKGTSIKGIRAIQEKRDIYYRPLLEVEKSQILEFLNARGQEYKTDSSNSDTKYKRNFIRREVLPLFEKINPNYMAAITNLAKTSIASQKIIDDKMREIKDNILKEGIVKKPLYIALDESYRLEFLNDYLGHKLKYRDYKTLKKLDDFILNNITKKTSLNKGEFLKVKKDKIFIEEKL